MAKAIIKKLFNYFNRRNYTELSNTVITLESRISRLERANLAMLKRLVQLSNQALSEMEANLSPKLKNKTKVYLTSSPDKRSDVEKKEPTYH
jgi:hypothetical protein